MLLPEAGLDRLIEQLRNLPHADRKAVLARLAPEERRGVRARLNHRVAVSAAPVSPFSPDIAARIATADTTLTGAGRKALEALIFPAEKLVQPQELRGPSLSQVLGGLLRRRGLQP